MLKIWGRTNSINVQKVMWAVAELGLEHERVDAGRQFGLVKEPWYLKMNPNGLVPTIDDGGFVLWESNAIVRYLFAKYGRPGSAEQRADADRWMEWYSTTYAAKVAPIFLGLIRTPPEERNMAAIEACRKATIETLTILEAHLAGRDYLCGSDFTMGDIPLGAGIYRWYNLPIERPPYPNIEAWYQRLRARPGYQKHVMIPLS
ncbi:MAG: glutathione S-transferase [Betaproteobacteria bacterium]|nr:glutathione S-transferase [Betaproteobacteria bacterium]